MYQIETRRFAENDLGKLNSIYDYHCVYILENDVYAYIGETKNITDRETQHSIDEKKKQYKFERIHIIGSKEAEGTPAKHFERMLIKLMKADNKFKVVNGNDGETTYYDRKNKFEMYFDELWPKLVERGLAKTKEFKTILNSNVYKYSPHTPLTKKQHETLTNIVNVINSEETEPHVAGKGFKVKPILIEGDAGTGKTVVATSLFHYLKNNELHKNKEIALVYSLPATRAEIQEVFRNTIGLSEGDVIAPVEVTKRCYDIIICDEAHRLRRGENLGMYSKWFKSGNKRLELDDDHDELDWVLLNSKCHILFYDKQQIVCPSDITHNSFEDRLYSEKRGTRLVKLDEQIRIRAGDKYVPYIHSIFRHEATAHQTFENYDLRLFTNFPDMVKLLREKEKEVGLCRLCGGYAWKWNKWKSDQKETYSQGDICIDGEAIHWNTETGGWVRNQKAKDEMGSIYTLAGLDLNYVGVVIGPDLYYDKASNKIKVNKQNFYDNKVKKGVSDKELKEYVLNTYAVLLTRGIYGTFIYICDEALREYFQKFVDVEMPSNECPRDT